MELRQRIRVKKFQTLGQKTWSRGTRIKNMNRKTVGEKILFLQPSDFSSHTYCGFSF